MRTPFAIFLLIIVTCSAGSNLLERSSDEPKITEKEFQIDFLDQIATLVDRMALAQLNQLLQQLFTTVKDAKYAQEFQLATNTHKLTQKIVIVKQLLDANTEQQAGDMHHFVTLRNVNFLRGVRQQLQDMQEASEKDMRQMRVYELCKQFYDGKVVATAAKQLQPHPTGTRMAPLQEAEEALSAANGSITIDMQDFGSRLYVNVRSEGAKIIDDYLKALRRLLEEVVEEKPDQQQANAVTLGKLLDEIDAILQTEDFYAKRQRLYDYLQSNLAEDYERFQNSQYANEDLGQILTKLREKGLDLFLGFLFGNFEFLERLFDEWDKLLPNSASESRPYDEESRVFEALPRLYATFKYGTDSEAKYETYMGQVRALQARTASNLTGTMHIYELLHNASQNLGPVTLNMIRAKCDEL